MPVRWLAETIDDRGAAARVGRDGDDLVAEWIGIARLVASRDGKNVRFTPEPDANPVGIEKIRNGVVTLLLRHLEGKIGLHGSAVAVGDRCAVFVGASGQGKSTLAAHACARFGASLVSDDAVAIEREAATWYALPLEAHHWLDETAQRALGFDEATGWSATKARHRATSLARRPPALAVVGLLAYADVDRPRVVPLRGIAAVAALVPLLVRFVIDEPDAQRRELDLLADLVSRVRIVRIERPHGFEHLASTAALAVDALEHGARP